MTKTSVEAETQSSCWWGIEPPTAVRTQQLPPGTQDEEPLEPSWTDVVRRKTKKVKTQTPAGEAQDAAEVVKSRHQ